MGRALPATEVGVRLRTKQPAEISRVFIGGCHKVAADDLTRRRQTLCLSGQSFAPGLNLRVIDKDGEPWFAAADVCRALDLPEHPRGGFGHHLQRLDGSEVTPISNLGVKLPGIGMGNSRVVSESGLYTLIMRSRKPEAQRFRKWVTGEVLPAIRKTGSYSVVKQAAPAAPQPQAPAAPPAQDTMQALAAAVTALR